MGAAGTGVDRGLRRHRGRRPPLPAVRPRSVVNRALVYGVLTVAVVGSYVAVVGLVGSYLSRRGDVVVSLVVTGVVAVCFQPLRERVQRSVNRLMYGERDDPYDALAALSRTLGTARELDAVLPAAVETIARALALGSVAVTVADGDAEQQRSVAAHGRPGGEPIVSRSSTRVSRSASFA
jgi:hypothetical protein